MTRGADGKAAGVAEFGGDGEGGEIVDAAETAQAFDAGAQRLDGEQIAELGFDGLEPADGFVDGADVSPVGLLERRQRPALGLEPSGMAFRPGFLGGGEPPAMAEEELRQAVACPQEIGTNVLPTAQEIARGFFLLGRNMDGRQGAGAIEHSELTGVAAIGLDAIARTSRN